MSTTVQGKQDQRDTTGPDPKELLSVKSVLASFLIAMKNYALYPSHHEICKKTLSNVKANLDRFLSDIGNFRIDVKKDELLYQGEVVHSEPPAEGSLPFTLFRDGVHWVEFQNDLSAEEVSGFFKILNEFRAPHEDADADLVTTLWEANFPHIRYEADDGFSDSEALISFADLSLGEEKAEDTAQEEGGEQPAMDDEDARTYNMPNVPNLKMDRALWELSDEEMKTLQKMVYETEHQDDPEAFMDVIDIIMLIVVREETVEEDAPVILEYLEDELRYILEQGEFQRAYRFLERMYGLSLSFEIQKPWAVPLLHRFFDDIASPAFLEILHHSWHMLKGKDAEQKKVLGGMLVLLPPKAVLALGPLLQQAEEAWVREQLIDVIASLSARDLTPLEQLLENKDEALVHRLVLILGRIKGERSSQLLMRMTGHGSARVRRDAVRVLSDREPDMFTALFHLIEDPEEAVRRQTLLYFSQQRNADAEALLLEYLRKGKTKVKSRQHVLDCFRALGRCGSSLSLPYLRELLLGRPLYFGYKRSFTRQCAAIAMHTMNQESARTILEKAEKSWYPTVRRAVRKALEKTKTVTAAGKQHV